MTTISAKSILASQHSEGFNDGAKPARVDTLLLRYPRCIHAEVMTHRMFSRNAASSRAIPVEKMLKDVFDDPFVPLFWGKNQKGMQASTECTAMVYIDKIRDRESAWLFARDNAVLIASEFARAGYHKQVVNRLLEPFAHITVVVTSVDWSNFLALRDHPDAEPHIRMLAQAVRKALEEAPVQTLGREQWHLPFVSAEDWEAAAFATGTWVTNPTLEMMAERELACIKLSVARCASTSYKTVDGFAMTMDRAIDLHDKLVASVPMHASPCEHQCKPDFLWAFTHRNPRWQHAELQGNLTGWVQYRKTLAGECL